MSSNAYLSLMLDAPLQSWGFSSRFERRTTGLYPTKSGIVGLICAAMGVSKGSDVERRMMPNLAALKMTAIAISRGPNRVRRVEDYHTVGGGYDKSQAGSMPRNAKEKQARTTLSWRQYLTDAKFGVILAGDSLLLSQVSAALKNPVWGVWFGRKNCIPAEPIYRGLFSDETKAQYSLLGDSSIEQFDFIEEVLSFTDGTDSFNDQPISFGLMNSSSECRDYSTRRIAMHPAVVCQKLTSEIPYADF